MNDKLATITNLFEEKEMPEDEAKKFCHNFLKAQNLSKNGEGEIPITLHQVKKYLSFREKIPQFDKN